MSSTLIEELLIGDSKYIKDLASNEAALVGFLTLVKQVDDLPEVDTRFYENSRSLYQATAEELSIDELIDMFSGFFGKPAKAAGKGLPVSLRFESVVKHLGGIRKDQSLFLKKLKTGSFYAALWPWHLQPGKVEIHLGISMAGISETDSATLATLVNKFLSQKKMETLSDVGGQIHGISLPSFLQMSEMEGATYTLKVSSDNRTGWLYLDDGSLIAARYGDLTGNEAAYHIISWDKAAIQIEAAEPDRVREIHDPLMHVMMESLKIKDEAGAADQAPPVEKDAKTPSPAPKPDAAPKLQPKPKPKPKAGAPAKPTAKPKSGPPKKAPAAPSARKKAPSPKPQPAPPAQAGGFQKPTDNSVGRQDRMSLTGKLLVVLGVVLVVAGIATFGSRLYAQYQLNRRYDRFLAELSATQQPKTKIDLIRQYLDDHPDDGHSGELQLHLNEARGEIEKADYDATILAVSRLPLDQKYEQQALKLYTEFLASHPESAYAPQINDAINGIRDLLGTAYFEDLKKVSDDDFMDRYIAYQKYLEQFPEGGKRQAVLQMIDMLAESYARSIEAKAENCDAEHRWDDCIMQCERFLTIFYDHAPAKRIGDLAATMRDKRDLSDLADQVARVADDFAAARKIYQDYLKAHPQSTQKIVLEDRIALLGEQLEKKTTWQRVESFAKNRSRDVVDRIEHLETYLEKHPASPYAGSARALRDELRPELQQAIKARQEAEARRQMLARQAAERQRVEETRQRIARLQGQVAARLKAVSTRFQDNGDGTVTDRVTGLVWTLLDSSQELGRCTDYEGARTYVNRLKTGGHTDWRLPNAGELATIYKNKPFFPQTGAAWYWTSESFARGYHKVVDVVTTTPETVFKRASQDESSCGAARAVRR